VVVHALLWMVWGGRQGSGTKRRERVFTVVSRLFLMVGKSKGCVAWGVCGRSITRVLFALVEVGAKGACRCGVWGVWGSSSSWCCPCSWQVWVGRRV
jgi:hypothetical protein